MGENGRLWNLIFFFKNVFPRKSWDSGFLSQGYTLEQDTSWKEPLTTKADKLITASVRGTDGMLHVLKSWPKLSWAVISPCDSRLLLLSVCVWHLCDHRVNLLLWTKRPKLTNPRAWNARETPVFPAFPTECLPPMFEKYVFRISYFSNYVYVGVSGGGPEQWWPWRTEAVDCHRA